MLLSPDVPIGNPSFALTEDQMATVVDLTCRGVTDARSNITSGMLEVPITRLVRKGMRRAKKTLNLTNLQVRGEHELDQMATNDPTILGRLDLTIQFLHQFGDEDAFVAIECKRVGAGHPDLNRRYVSDGVNRFVTGQYGAGHHWGMMLGYVLALPIETPVQEIDGHLQKTYGDDAKLHAEKAHELALGVHRNVLVQAGGPHKISLLHVFVDATFAAAGNSPHA